MTAVPKVLVLGGATGLLGCALVKRAMQLGWHTLSLGREDGPIMESPFLEHALGDFNPDIVFNAIGCGLIDTTEEDDSQALAVNRAFPCLLRQLLKGSSAHLVHFSTDFVFDGRKKTPYTEEDKPNPLSRYGQSKLAGENILLGSGGMENCTVVRTAWLFGGDSNNFVAKVARAVREGVCIKAVFDQVGSPSYAEDVAEMALLLAQMRAAGLFHCVNGGQASWCELASEVVSILDVNAEVLPIAAEQSGWKAPRPPYSVLSTQHLTEVTGYTPRSWPLALREYIFQGITE